MGAILRKSRIDPPPVRAVKAASKDRPLVRERRDQLTNAAIEVIKEKGFHAATMRDIGRAAGMTQGTIYNYIRSKDDVLYLVCDRLVSEYQEETRKALETISDPVQRVRSGARAVAEAIHRHEDEILLMFQNVHLLDSRSRRVILARVDGFIQLFQSFLGDAAREAGIPIGNDLLAANIFTYLPTVMVLRRWSLRPELSDEAVLLGLTEFLLRGLGFPVSAPASA